MADAVATLMELQVQRRFCIKATLSQTNRTGGMVRRALGWSLALPEGERKALNKRGEAILRTGLAAAENSAAARDALRGKLKEDDLAVAEALLGLFEVTARGLVPYEEARRSVERDMRRLARQLPVQAWAAEVPGFGELGLAVLVGEAGDLARYPNPAKLWKRLGLAPKDGKSYPTWRRDGGLTSEDWTDAGYVPRRRGEVHGCVTDPLFRRQTMVAGPYRAFYDTRRLRTAETHPDWPKARAHMDALRIMTKHLVSDLWSEWRRPTSLLKPQGPVAAAEHLEPEPVSA